MTRQKKRKREESNLVSSSSICWLKPGPQLRRKKKETGEGSTYQGEKRRGKTKRSPLFVGATLLPIFSKNFKSLRTFHTGNRVNSERKKEKEKKKKKRKKKEFQREKGGGGENSLITDNLQLFIPVARSHKW